MSEHKHIAAAWSILAELGLPRAQQNERSALCLLALLDLTPGKRWAQATNPLIGITPIMDWVRLHYGKDYAPNTRETVRRQTMHQFVAAGIALYNPDDPTRPVNSPKAVYRIEEESWLLLIESVTSHGPVDGKRHDELKHLFSESSAGLVYVTAFPNRTLMARHLGDIAWETEVWVANAPSHLIHFNGTRFLGPYNRQD